MRLQRCNQPVVDLNTPRGAGTSVSSSVLTRVLPTDDPRAWQPGEVRGFRLGLVVVAVVIGVGSAVLGNWWTAGAMVCVVVGQVLAERDARRRAARGEVRPPG